MYFNTAPKEKIKGSIYDIKYFAGIGIFIHDPEEESNLEPDDVDPYIDNTN
jgi:hypothetical protein